MRCMVCLGLAAAFAMVSAAVRADEASPQKYWVFFGTNTGTTGSKGIYRSEYDPKTGKLSPAELAAEVKMPSFLAIHPTGRFLYAVGETGDFGGKKTGTVHAYEINAKTGELKALNTQSSGGPGPCHINVDATGRCALVANYSGGSCAALPIMPDGSLGEAGSFIQHTGKSVDPGRQEGPHAHSINVDPKNKFAVVADLGLDQVLIFKLDPSAARLTPNDPPHVNVAPGAGPRHFAFHPTAPFAYVINELGNTVTVLSWDGDKGALKPVQSITTLPSDFKGKSYTAEVIVHPSGKFVYGSNRGHDSIACFKVDMKTGMLTATGHQGTGIKTPRNFALDPTGKFMLVGNQASGSVLVFAVDQETGELRPTDQKIQVPSAICVRFVAKK